MIMFNIPGFGGSPQPLPQKTDDSSLPNDPSLPNRRKRTPGEINRRRALMSDYGSEGGGEDGGGDGGGGDGGF